MLRVIAALFALGVGVIGWVLLLPQAPSKGHLASAPAVTPADAAPSAAPSGPAPSASLEAAREIRVVYPGTDPTAQVRKLSDKVAASTPVIPVSAPAPVAVAPVPPAAPVVAAAAAPAANPSSTVVAAAAETSAVSPAPANPQAVNINTASVDALNQLPGAGRIGRTIASHRPYRSVEDLLSKRVVRKSVYDMIKNQVAAN